jgi:DNA-binding IclR family transcriptional regulator
MASGAEHERTGPALKGVRRAFDVLEYIANRPGRATDIAAGLGVSWATLHRTLNQLEADGFLARDPQTLRYTIGARLWYVGTAYLSDHPILGVARPYLEVADTTRGSDIAYTVQLTERSGNQAVTLYSRHKPGEEITKATYGFHFPLHCGAKAQVLLAHAGPDFIDQYLAGGLEALTAETLTAPKALNVKLKKIRAEGHAITEGDVQAFTGSVATPVFNRDQAAVASVCFIFRRSVLRVQDTTAMLVEEAMHTAQLISSALGWKPDVRAAP